MISIRSFHLNPPYLPYISSKYPWYRITVNRNKEIKLFSVNSSNAKVILITILIARPHPEGPKFENSTTYIPAEMAVLPKTKIGMPVGWQSKRGRTKVRQC